jgi:hypothetical protein
LKNLPEEWGPGPSHSKEPYQDKDNHDTQHPKQRHGHGGFWVADRQLPEKDGC